MTFFGVLGLLVLAMIAALAACGAHAICARLKTGAYVQLWAMLTAALFVFALLERSGLVVSAGGR